MYWEIELTPEEIEETLQATYDKIIHFKMETMAILTLESIKPWSYVGGELLRAALAPIMPAFGEGLGLTSEKMLQVFEKRENIERLIQMIEESLQKEEAERRAKKKAEKAAKEEQKKRDQAVKDALREAEKKNRNSLFKLP
ncbi:MAG: hypothetical protein NWF07_03795 [Candidatus Bathyarchaeota archaeon]|nr:hypothetical protein [Candidatus Bathyarchaeota archaeon]